MPSELRIVTAEVVVRIKMRVGENQDAQEVLENMDYNFIASETTDAMIMDTEITEWEVKG